MKRSPLRGFRGYHMRDAEYTTERVEVASLCCGVGWLRSIKGSWRCVGEEKTWRRCLREGPHLASLKRSRENG